MDIETGKIIFNDGKTVKTQVGNRVLIYEAAEHDPKYFSLGETVMVIGSTVYKNATNGHTFLITDQVEQ